MILFIYGASVSAQGTLTNLTPDIGDCQVEIQTTIGECANIGPQFCFDSPMWQDNILSPSCTFSPVPLQGINFDGSCPPFTINVEPPFAPMPTTLTLPDGTSLELECPPLPFSGTIMWTVTDNCGESLSWSFEIILECIDCPFPCNAITLPPCRTCEEADPVADPLTGCHSCDALELDGFCGCTPSGSTAIDPTQFNNPLCDDGFVPNNMSWWTFTAGAQCLEVDIGMVDCIATTGIGIQTGIYAACELGQCLASDNACGSNVDKSFSLCDLTVGDEYFIYVDGCAGAGCVFDISVSGQVEFDLDEIIAVAVDTDSGGRLNECRDMDPVTLCVGEEFRLSVLHDDSSPTEFPPPFDEECETYDPNMEANYFWSVNSPFIDVNFGDLSGGQVFRTPDDEFQFPPIATMNPGSYEFCIELIDTECSDAFGPVCVTVVVTSCGSNIDNDGDGVTSDQDCDDNDASNFPGNAESCDGRDNNCNGIIDEGFENRAPDLSCDATQNTILVTWDMNPTASVYNVFFNGVFFISVVDNQIEVTGLAPGTTQDIRVDIVFNNGCETLTSTISCTTSNQTDNDGDGVPFDQDCDDNDAANYPGNVESCDGRDNNCNGIIDEGFEMNVVPVLSCNATQTSVIVAWDENPTASIYNIFFNGVFFTSVVDNQIEVTGLAPGSTQEIRVEIVFDNGCTTLSSSISCTTGTAADNDGDGVPSDQDCDDNDANNFPGNPELCDGQDNNCNGMVDEGLITQDYYVDADGDGFGSDAMILNDCIQPLGFVSNADDCNDNDPTINPAAPEVPNNSVDEDCDGEVQIIDNDGDGWNSDLDCDDLNAAINPAATEVPGNGIDEDCDGEDGPLATLDLEGERIEVYPNPVSEILYINHASASLSYELYDLHGSRVGSGIISGQRIDVSLLTSGLYVVRLFRTESKDRKVELLIIKA